MINEYNDYSKKCNRLQLINDYNYPISGLNPQTYPASWCSQVVERTGPLDVGWGILWLLFRKPYNIKCHVRRVHHSLKTSFVDFRKWQAQCILYKGLFLSQPNSPYFYLCQSKVVPVVSYYSSLLSTYRYLYIDALILVLNIILATGCKATSNDLSGTLIYARVISLTSFLLKIKEFLWRLISNIMNYGYLMSLFSKACMYDSCSGYFYWLKQDLSIVREPLIVIKSVTNFINVLLLNFIKYMHTTYGMLYVEWFVSDLRRVGGFLQVLGFPPPIKLTTII